MGTEILALLIGLVAVAAVCAAITAGFLRRRRAASAPGLTDVPADGPGDTFAVLEGEYVSTSAEARPLERMPQANLGFKSVGSLAACERGIVVSRRGERDVLIPAADIEDVGRSAGVVGKFVEAGGLVTIAWTLGGERVLTGFRARYADQTQPFVETASDFYQTTQSHAGTATGSAPARGES
ncbi:hypothetical protein [Falsarthrobacter nasiphocae]|uniref:PH domain-containing protein n=1 Tax=Falsarthrobacter nasiphocae TaxID=189863 RepID=A0AAE4C660_9MICC|nr:hypothetical protein [Falsarthrobacter nasiphocae]MDR6892986.1 hypothetical protein [Falsarthrobacter nasiphocae]